MKQIMRAKYTKITQLKGVNGFKEGDVEIP